MKIDTSLVVAAKSGDQQGFTRLYEEITPALYRMALYTLGNSHDAEDVVSEAFVEAYRGIGNLRDPNSFQPWIYKILSVRCNRKIKEYIKSRNTLDIDQFLELPGEDSDISENSLRRIELIQAMEILSPEERRIVCLSVFDGYTMKEIAYITESPQGTISSKLFRAFKKMRKKLENAQDLEGGKQ